jgi:hypothetical protein
MNDSKEICLYFDDNVNYNPMTIAQELCNRYKELGNPILLPVSKDGRAPVIIFQENTEFFLRCNMETLNFVVNHNYFDKLEGIIFDIVDTFEEENVKFVRIGYVNNLFFNKEKIDVVRDIYLKEDKTSDMEEFQLFLYKELSTKYGNINAWERVITEGNRKHELLIQYDFNSRQDEKQEFDMKYIKEFIKVSNEYIESRTNI